jgi:hypothetical protein
MRFLATLSLALILGFAGISIASADPIVTAPPFGALIPYGDVIAAVIRLIADALPALITLALAIVGRIFGAPIVALLKSAQVDKLLYDAAHAALAHEADTVAGRTLELHQVNPIVGAMIAYADDATPGLIASVGGEAKLRARALAWLSAHNYLPADPIPDATAPVVQTSAQPSGGLGQAGFPLPPA